MEKPCTTGKICPTCCTRFPVARLRQQRASSFKILVGMKNILFLILLHFSLQLSAQNISGLYSGTLRNDSSKFIQKYELALSEYRGKITGYAYATFIKNDTFYYSIRRVKAVREAGQLVVEDGEMLANNFPVKPDKGVHRISYIPIANLKEGDTLTTFTGTWKTTQTKKFYAIPGSMDMKRDGDSARSTLIAHLRELNIIAPENKMQTASVEKQAVAKHTDAEKQHTIAEAKPTPAAAH